MPHPLLTPDRLVRHVSEITPAFLSEAKVRAVVTDLDNTIVGWRSETVEAEVEKWLVDLRAEGIGVCIASNTRHFSRLERLAKQLGILHVPGNSNKPGTGGLKRALGLLQTQADETAMVGDQLFTDILAGNRLGMVTILVNPLTTQEFIGTRIINRTAERFVLRGSLKRR